MSALQRLRSVQVSSRTAAISILVLLAAAAAVIVMASNVVGGLRAQPKTSSPKKTTTAKAEVKVSEEKPVTSAGKTAVAASKQGGVGRQDPCLVIARRNLFAPLRQSQNTSPADGGAKNPRNNKQAQKGGRNLPTLPPALVAVPSGANPAELRKNLAYTGMVEVGGATQALLENLQTKETRFVGQGESAFGCRVVSISARSVALDAGGMPFTLSIGENKPDLDPGAKPSGGGPPTPSPEAGKGGPPSPPQPKGGKGGPPGK